MEIGDGPDDQEYVNTLQTLSEGSVRRNFNPYTDIDWNSPEFAVTPNDERWEIYTVLADSPAAGGPADGSACDCGTATTGAETKVAEANAAACCVG